MNLDPIDGDKIQINVTSPFENAPKFSVKCTPNQTFLLLLFHEHDNFIFIKLFKLINYLNQGLTKAGAAAPGPISEGGPKIKQKLYFA